MRLPRSNHRKNTCLGVGLGVAMLPSVFASAQDIKLNVTYVCNGERIFVENCNIRDVSDTSTCMVGHPDHVRNGLMAYTTETRGALKKLFPTCQQPSAKELAAAEAFKKKQQQIYDANVAKANPQSPPQTAAAQSTPARRPRYGLQRMPKSVRCAVAFRREGFPPVVPVTHCWAPLVR